MEITVGLFLFLFIAAFVCEFIDSSLGMGYGTILSPVLILMGFDPLIAVPAILLSQAFGGFTASIFHHQFENASFSRGSRDLKIVFIISVCGILVTILAVFIAFNIPRVVLKTYIGLLVLSMGVILLAGRKFRFSWKKMIGVGIISAFNKGLSGGGFGPVVTGGQIISGQRHKGAIAATTLAEAPICTIGFVAYLVGGAMRGRDAPIMSMPFAEFLTAMFSHKLFQWELVLALLLGSVFVAPFGAFTTKIIKTEKLAFILGILVTVLGIWTLLKTYL